MIEYGKKHWRDIVAVIVVALGVMLATMTSFAQTPSPTPAQCAGSHNTGLPLGPIDVCAQTKAQANAFATMDNKIQNDASKLGRKFCKEQFADCKCELDEVTFQMNCSPNPDVKCKKGSGLKGFSCTGLVNVVKCRCK
jgi:hypothetical protein